MRDPYRFIEISLEARKAGASAPQFPADFFFGAGIKEKELARLENRTRRKICFYTRSRAQALSLGKQFRKKPPGGWVFRTKGIGRRDWFDKWQRSYPVTPLGRLFAAVPVWRKKEACPGRRTPVFLDPRGAFGSGMHETTRLVIRLMESCPGVSKSFLDLGTGTGILSVVAAKLGACEIQGIDHDRESVVTARKNLALNGVKKSRFRAADLSRWVPERRFDLVAANLLSSTLIRHRESIVSAVRPGGRLIVSGIGRSHLPGVLAAFRVPALRCARILKSRSWAAILFHKKARRKA